MALWHEVLRIMPPIGNIALKDTLASIGNLPSAYDTFFAAHELPCCIDYPPCRPVSEERQGLEHLEAWLGQLVEEARFLARFDMSEMASYLDALHLSYKDLLVSLYEPVLEAWQIGALEMKPPTSPETDVSGRVGDGATAAQPPRRPARRSGSVPGSSARNPACAGGPRRRSRPSRSPAWADSPRVADSDRIQNYAY